jgi:hypothetical protein
MEKPVRKAFNSLVDCLDLEADFLMEDLEESLLGITKEEFADVYEYDAGYIPLQMIGPCHYQYMRVVQEYFESHGPLGDEVHVLCCSHDTHTHMMMIPTLTPRCMCFVVCSHDTHTV